MLKGNLYNNKYMIALTQIKNNGIFAFIAVLVFKLLSRKVFVYKYKRQQKLPKSRLLFKKIANCTGKLLQNYKVGMRNFQDTFETRKRSFINVFSICMTVPLKAYFKM